MKDFCDHRLNMSMVGIVDIRKWKWKCMFSTKHSCSYCITRLRLVIKINVSKFCDSLWFQILWRVRCTKWWENSHHHANITNIYRMCGWALTWVHCTVFIYCHSLSHSNSTICVKVLLILQKGGVWGSERVRVLFKISHKGSRNCSETQSYL